MNFNNINNEIIEFNINFKDLIKKNNKFTLLSSPIIFLNIELNKYNITIGYQIYKSTYYHNSYELLIKSIRIDEKGKIIGSGHSVSGPKNKTVKFPNNNNPRYYSNKVDKINISIKLNPTLFEIYNIKVNEFKIYNVYNFIKNENTNEYGIQNFALKPKSKEEYFPNSEDLKLKDEKYVCPSCSKVYENNQLNHSFLCKYSNYTIKPVLIESLSP